MRATLLLIAIVAGLPGCAVYDPYRVWRFTFDYNSEREVAFQAGTFDHLPPKPLTVRMMKWGYNVGPTPDRAVPMIPANSPVKPEVPPLEGVEPGGSFDDFEPLPPPIWPLRPPIPWQPPLPPQPMFGPENRTPHQPSMLPAQPQRQEPQRQEPRGPTARLSSSASTTPSSWIFASP